AWQFFLAAAQAPRRFVCAWLGPVLALPSVEEVMMRLFMTRTVALVAAMTMVTACNRPNTPLASKASFNERVAGAADARTPPSSAGAPESYADVVDRVSPAVVTI